MIAVIESADDFTAMLISVAGIVFILMMSAARTSTTTPTKTPTKGVKNVRSPIRSCVVCNRELVNYTKYKSLNTENFKERINAVIDAGINDHVSNYICGPCMTHLKKIEQWSDAQNKHETSKSDFCGKYFATREVHKHITASPVRERSKRMSVESPSSRGHAGGRTSRKVRRSLINEATTSSGSGAEGDISNLTNSLQNLQMQDVFQLISNECQDLCSTNYPSSFRDTSKAALMNWSYKDQEAELLRRAPHFLQAIQAAATSDSLSRAQTKNTDSMRPAIMHAAGVLLQTRNKDMIAHGTMVGLQMDVGNASKLTQMRMQSKSLCIAPSTIKNKQIALGVGFDKEVIGWKSQVEADVQHVRNLEKEIYPLQNVVDNNLHTFEETLKLNRLKAMLNEAKMMRHPGFKLVGDNIDFSISPRYWKREEGRKSIHYFNFLAVENRISGNHLPDDTPIGDVLSLPLTAFLPDCNDNSCLREEWITLVGRVITKYIPAFQPYQRHIEQHIPHEYSHLTKKKTKVVALGVITESENSKDGIAKIMDHMNNYVPLSNTKHPVCTLVSGDLLTVQRQIGVQEDRRDSAPQVRWGGMISGIEDWHALANFYQVLWKNLYTSDSAGCGDVGTLYAAKNFLRANNVPPDPMKDFYASEELLTKYSEALIITAALDHFQMTSVKNEPVANKKSQDESEEDYIRKQLTLIVDRYAIHHTPDGGQVESSLTCPSCPKQYKTVAGLRAHIKVKHPEQREGALAGGACISDYCKTAFGMCMLALDFNDARKHGDGERLVRLYKFLILHFRAVGKDNYARYTLRLVAQVNATLTPRLAHQMKWNRFVNNLGKVDTNVECDKENEHFNKQIKGQCRAFQGKLTDAAIKRVSEATQPIQTIIKLADKESGVKMPSGKHDRIDASSDVLALVDVLCEEAVFRSDRKLKGLPHFSVNPFQKLDMSKTCVWMRNCLKEFSQHKAGCFPA